MISAILSGFDMYVFMSYPCMLSISMGGHNSKLTKRCHCGRSNIRFHVKRKFGKTFVSTASSLDCKYSVTVAQSMSHIGVLCAIFQKSTKVEYEGYHERTKLL